MMKKFNKMTRYISNFSFKQSIHQFWRYVNNQDCWDLKLKGRQLNTFQPNSSLGKGQVHSLKPKPEP
jgi:hypothetical protein